MSGKAYHLYGGLKGGSAIVEAMLTRAGLPFEVTDFEWDDIYGSSEAVLAINPVGQVPALKLPDGRMMTESAAMALHLSDIAPQARLAPPPGDPLRVEFLHWLIVLVGAIYPMFTFGDKPERWTGEGAGAAALLASTEARKKELWAIVERDAPLGTWFLGERQSALDLYVAVMTHWRPRRAYFLAALPKLAAIIQRVDALDDVQPVWRRHFSQA
jgi:GST-like protein